MTDAPAQAAEDGQSGPLRAATDLAWRLAYRLAHRLRLGWWRLRPSTAEGASVAVWWQGRLLVVRTSYRSLLELPAGGRRQGESPREAALRELREETGLVAPPAELEGPVRLEFTSEQRRITEHVFVWHPRTAPAPRADRREIVEVLLLSPDELADRALAPNLALWLEQASRSHGIAASADHGTGLRADTVAPR